MELDRVIISALQVSRIALNLSNLFRADLKNMKFHSDYTFISCPTFPGCFLKMSRGSLEKLSFPPHCLNQEGSADVGIHHLLLPREHMMK
jgi:hypothetical protein